MTTQKVSYTAEEVLEKFGSRNFIATPETFKMGIHHLLGTEIAKRFKGRKVVADVCTGGGFTALCLAREVERVVAIDIDPHRLQLARSNAEVAGLVDKIQFIKGDVRSSQILERLSKIEAVSADPDWALPGRDKGDHVTSIYKMGPPIDILLSALQKVTNNIAIRLPKETDLQELDDLPLHETEEVYMDGKHKFYMLYFGNLMRKVGRTELSIHTL